MEYNPEMEVNLEEEYDCNDDLPLLQEAGAQGGHPQGGVQPQGHPLSPPPGKTTLLVAVLGR